MATIKTQRNKGDVIKFINQVASEQKRKDSFELLEIMKRVTGCAPEMWGDAIIGFGSYHYKYESGREGDWFLAGFSPRKQNLSIYIMSGFESYPKLLTQLGKHKISKACLYVNKLADIDLKVLEKIISESVRKVRQKYG